MERELRIRQEIINGGTQATEQTTAHCPADTATADTQPLPNNTTGDRQAVRAADSHAGADESLAPAEPQLADEGERSADTGGAGTNQPEPHADTADTLTGWETERAIFFSATAAFAESGMDTAVGGDTLDLAGIGSSVVQLGRALERLDSPVPLSDATTRPVVKERKRAVGQREDDHSGYDFEMKM